MDARVQTNLPTGCEWLPLAIKGDERGSLVAIEAGRTIAWDVRRVYYIFGTKPGVTRGLHAHLSLRQCVVPVSGSCTMLLDDGRIRQAVSLDNPALGLLLPPMIWREMSDFSPDCVLLVLADGLYDLADYIRDYDEFRRLALAQGE